MRIKLLIVFIGATLGAAGYFASQRPVAAQLQVKPTTTVQHTASKPLVKPTIPVTPVTSTVQHTSTPAAPQANNVQSNVQKPAATPNTASVSAPSNPGGKCYDTSQCLNPDRPYYDMWGNEFDYMGNLIHAVCPNVPDPISGQNNPECVCPAPTNQGTYYIQGYDKNTGQVVCGFEYYHACPYADAQPADGAVCAKLTQEQGGTN